MTLLNVEWAYRVPSLGMRGESARSHLCAWLQRSRWRLPLGVKTHPIRVALHGPLPCPHREVSGLKQAPEEPSVR